MEALKARRATLRRVLDHPATRCLLSCLVGAAVRRAEPRAPARRPGERGN